MPAPEDERLARLLLQLGVMRREEIEQCVRNLARLEREGQPRSLGELAVEMGYLEREDMLALDRILQTAARRAAARAPAPPGANVAKPEPVIPSPRELGDIVHLLPEVELYCASCGEVILEETLLENGVRRGRDGFLCPRCAHQDLRPGEVFHGFRITRRLGTGRLGPTYSARDLAHRSDVAIKYLPERLFRGGVEQRHFQEAAQRCTALAHPRLARLVRVGRAGRDFFIVHEYVSGVPLVDYAQGQSRKAIVCLLTEVAEGLEVLARSGVCHGELRPRKIMVGQDGHVRLLDAGLPAPRFFKVVPLPDDERFLAPELKDGKGTETLASDIYALGVMMHELLCRHPQPMLQTMESGRATELHPRLMTLIQSMTCPSLPVRMGIGRNVSEELRRIIAELS